MKKPKETSNIEVYNTAFKKIYAPYVDELCRDVANYCKAVRKIVAKHKKQKGKK